MLRITRIEDNPARANFKVEGRLVSDWVHLVEHECQQVCQGNRQVVLDLMNVTFVDEVGITMLQTLTKDRRIILHTSEFINQLLSHTGSSS